MWKVEDTKGVIRSRKVKDRQYKISLLSRRIEEFFYNKYVDIKFNAHGAFLK
jgi:hypothetical protein